MKHILRSFGWLTALLLPMSSWAIVDPGSLTLNYQLVPSDASPVPLDGHWIIALLLLVTTATVFRKRAALAQSAPDDKSAGLPGPMLKWLLIAAAAVWALVTAGIGSTWAMSNPPSFTIYLQSLTQSLDPQASFSMNSNQSLIIPCALLNAVPSTNINVINDFGITLVTRGPSLMSSAYASAPPSLRANTLIKSAVSTCQLVRLDVSACVNQNLAPGASCQVGVSAHTPV